MLPESPADRSTILLFSDAPYAGGAERYLSLLAGGLDRARFDPALVIASRGRLDALRRDAEQAGVAVHETGPVDSARGLSAFRRLTRRLCPAILHLNLPGPFNAACGLVAPVGRLSGARHVVSTEHLPMVPSFARARLLRGIGGRFIERVLTVSEDNRGHLARIHRVDPARVRVVRIGVPDPGPVSPAGLRTQTGIGSSAFVLIAVGALEERKGHRHAIDALGLLPGDVHLFVAGSGEAREKLSARAAAAGVAGRVHFLGQRTDVSSLLADADCLVLSSELEATPYVIVEAMAAGLPVVASGIFGIPELVEEGVTGLLVPPGDPAAIARAIAALAADPAIRRRMGAAARRRYEERFTLERFVAETVAVYRELLDATKGGDT